MKSWWGCLPTHPRPLCVDMYFRHRHATYADMLKTPPLPPLLPTRVRETIKFTPTVQARARLIHVNLDASTFAQGAALCAGVLPSLLG